MYLKAFESRVGQYFQNIVRIFRQIENFAADFPFSLLQSRAYKALKGFMKALRGLIRPWPYKDLRGLVRPLRALQSP